jgi:membrane protein required for colicin V production
VDNPASTVQTITSTMPSMVQGISPFDLIGIGIILLLGIRCAFRGLVRETMEVAGIFVGVLFAVLFSNLLAPLLETWLGKTPWNQVIAFAVIFLLSLFLMHLIHDALASLVEGLEIETVDSALGFVLGAAEGALVVFLLLFLFNLQEVYPMRPALAESQVYKLMSPLFSYADNLISSTVASAAGAGGP